MRVFQFAFYPLCARTYWPELLNFVMVPFPSFPKSSSLEGKENKKGTLTRDICFQCITLEIVTLIKSLGV